LIDESAWANEPIADFRILRNLAAFSLDDELAFVNQSIPVLEFAAICISANVG